MEFSPLHIFAVLFCLISPLHISGECFGGVETYEKTTGVGIIESDAQGLLHQPGAAVTRDCTSVCKQSSSCKAFTVDYEKSHCDSYTRDSMGQRDKLKVDPRTNYFEKVCYTNLGVGSFQQICGDRLWAFERVLGAYLEGFDDKEERGVQTKVECEKLCLLETEFTCRSAEYDESLKICRLSREDRRTQPSAFRRQTGLTVDYLENQCVKQLPDCRYTSRQDFSVISMDDLQFANSREDCETLCDHSRGFTCRSSSFDKNENRCYLSADDAVSLMGAPPHHKRGAVLSEKQCSINHCEGGLFTFEKVTAHFLRTAKQEPIVLSNTAPGITLDCIEKCKGSGGDCPAFLVDHSSMRCFKLDRNTQGRGEELTRKDGQNYFEKICLRGNIRGCRGRAWAFERRPARELRGHDDLVLHNVPSRRDCEERCLAESRFVCRSAEYHTQTTECRLSREDRRTRPNDFVEAPMHIEYLENQCIQPERKCGFEVIPDSDPRYLDVVIHNVGSEAECMERCNTNSEFLCQSFSYYAAASQCFISGDDKASAGEEAYQKRPKTTYNERNCKKVVTEQLGVGDGYDRTGILPPFGNGLNDKIIPPTLSTDSQIGRCSYGRMTYEKVSGYELDRGQKYLLYKDNLKGISDRCAKRCQSDIKCHAFNLDYNRNECSALEFANDEVRFGLRRSAGVAYFEGICLRGGGCGLQWTFERFPNFVLRGHEKEVIKEIGKTHCEDRCLEERRFSCRSASYDWKRRECRLSTEDRFTQPRDFIPAPDSDYLENQCAPQSRQCTYQNVQKDRYLIYVDKAEAAPNELICQRACDKEREFNCRSFSYILPIQGPIGGGGLSQCLLSGDTGANTGPNAFQVQSGSIYSEKECDPRSVPLPELGRPYVESPYQDPRPYPRDPYPLQDQRIREHYPRDPPYPVSSSLPRDPYVGTRFPPGSSIREPFGIGRDRYGADRDRELYGGGGSGIGNGLRDRDYYPARDGNRDSYYSGRNHFPPLRDVYPTRDRIGNEPFSPTSTYVGGGVGGGGVGGGDNYLDPELSPYRCRHTVTFEKIVGYTYNGARKELIPLRTEVGITSECIRECEHLRERCLALSIEPLTAKGQRCFSLDRSSEADSSLLHPIPDLVHFEKICLRERGCGKLWTFTRVPEYELAGPGDLELRNILTRRQCQDECLRSVRTVCASATYYARERLCKLSSETRRTRAESYRKAGPDVDYMENECAPIPPHCEYSDSPGRYLPSADKLVPRVFAAEECRRACDTEPEFSCRAFNFHSYRRDCLISSDDTLSSSQPLVTDPDFFYAEKGTCNNVKVDCTPSDMLVTINFGSPFAGRVFATGNPQSCFEMGNDRSQVVLRISLGTQCGTLQQGRGRYVNHVVVQQNPVIMQESDKTVRVECSFDANDQTVSYAPNGGLGPKDHEGGGISVTVPFKPLPGNNIVTNTAPTPNVRMRIIMRNGQDASVVGLGEELQLRIEIDPSSAFGIFARNLEARTEFGELLTLIDNIGCPRDPNVFQMLEVDPGSRNLFANFKAFRFPSTATVNFVATVQFCQDLCQPVRCQGLDSFGRKKRSLAENPTNSTHEFPQIKELKLTVPVRASSTTEKYNIFQYGKLENSKTTTTTEGPKMRSDDKIIELNSEHREIEMRTSTQSPRKNEEEFILTPQNTATLPPKIMPDLPSSLPIHSKLIVIPRSHDASGPLPLSPDDLSRTLNGSLSYGADGELVLREMGESGSNVCSTKGTVISLVLSLLLLHTALFVSFYFFYKRRERLWEKERGLVGEDSTLPRSLPHSPPGGNRGLSSEVIFRNVYDRFSFGTQRSGGRRPFLIPSPTSSTRT